MCGANLLFIFTAWSMNADHMIRVKTRLPFDLPHCLYLAGKTSVVSLRTGKSLHFESCFSQNFGSRSWTNYQALECHACAKWRNSKEIISLTWRHELQNHSPMANLRVAYKYYEPKKTICKVHDLWYLRTFWLSSILLSPLQLLL